MAGRLSARRRSAAAALVLLVVALHLWLADGVLESRLGSGATRDTRPRRIEIAFVRTLAPAAPPVTPPRPPRPRRKAAAVAAPVPAASSPEAAASVADAADAAEAVASAVGIAASAVPDDAAAVPAPEAAASDPGTAAAQALAAAASAPAEAASAAVDSFEWPPSTRLSYQLTGNFRGPVEGQAQVEWLRSGSHYQVHLDLDVGPPFAPLAGRSLSSDGELGAQGLQPQRYDEETRIAFRDPRRLTMAFDADRVRLANGNTVPRPPGVQDTASQFVQLTWLFTMRPQLLAAGTLIEIPLALPRYVDTWTYEVLAHETLDTPFGSIDTVHVKPRRAPRPGLELTAEMWIAPSLQYLPVRIVIHQDADTYVDLLIRSLPLQGAPR